MVFENDAGQNLLPQSSIFGELGDQNMPIDGDGQVPGEDIVGNGLHKVLIILGAVARDDSLYQLLIIQRCQLLEKSSADFLQFLYSLNELLPR